MGGRLGCGNDAKPDTQHRLPRLTLKTRLAGEHMQKTLTYVCAHTPMLAYTQAHTCPQLLPGFSFRVSKDKAT